MDMCEYLQSVKSKTETVLKLKFPLLLKEEITVSQACKEMNSDKTTRYKLLQEMHK